MIGPRVTHPDPLTTRVVAPNASPMTLDGTNTYLLGEPRSGAVVVVDPGPRLDAHREAIEAAVHALDAEVAAVVVTHHHADHAEAVGWAAEWKAPLRAFAPRLVPGAVPLQDTERLSVAGIDLIAVHTPGHASDHLCLRVNETGAVLTGDHVLGAGTTVVAWPDGDMASYMASLERVRAIGATRLYPGHGPVLDDPARTLTDYLEHRRRRENEVLGVVAEGVGTPAAMVARIYADVDPALHPAAERSVRAHLAKLVAEGRLARRAEEDAYVDRLG